MGRAISYCQKCGADVFDDIPCGKCLADASCPTTSKDMYMEDAARISLKVSDMIETELIKYGISLSDDQQDKLFLPILDALEEYTNGIYKHEH